MSDLCERYGTYYLVSDKHVDIRYVSSNDTFTWCTYSDPAKPENIMCNHTYKTFSMIYLAHFTGCTWYISDFAGIHNKPFIFLTLLL